jgi:purine-nucleoside phosphorylase
MKSEMALVLGSGLGGMVDEMEIEEQVSFADAGLPVSQVAGHQGRFILGTCHGHRLWVMQGRVHLYEGHRAQEVTRGVRWLAEQGVTTLILTNAAGTMRRDFPPGQWMVLSDHINLTGTSPLEGGPNFIDMSEVYSQAWRDFVLEKSSQLGVPLHQGVYAGLRGPQYETPAEIRMLQAMGADAVGMSTVLEAIQARALGMDVMGFSCLTNWAAGMSGASLDHSEVLDTGKQAAAQFMQILQAIFER